MDDSMTMRLLLAETRRVLWRCDWCSGVMYLPLPELLDHIEAAHGVTRNDLERRHKPRRKRRPQV